VQDPEVYIKAKNQLKIFKRVLFLIVIASLAIGGFIGWVFGRFSSMDGMANNMGEQRIGAREIIVSMEHLVKNSSAIKDAVTRETEGSRSIDNLNGRISKIKVL